MESRLYLIEELPETYGRLQGFCTDLFLGRMIQKAQDEGLTGEVTRYTLLRQCYRQSQRRKEKWAIKVAQFNEDLATIINRGRWASEEAHKLLAYKKKIEDGSHKIGETVFGPGPILGPEEDKNPSFETYTDWADSKAQLPNQDPLCPPQTSD